MVTVVAFFNCAYWQFRIVGAVSVSVYLPVRQLYDLVGNERVVRGVLTPLKGAEGVIRRQEREDDRGSSSGGG